MPRDAQVWTTMKLLLAIDADEPSELAVHSVEARPWPSGTQIRVLSVNSVPPGEPPPDVPVPTAPLGEVPVVWPVGTLATHKVTEAASERIAARAVESLRSAGLFAEACVRDGQPGPEIVEEARRWHADLIVMGSHGYGALKRLLLGSVASHVLHHAPCSVEVVRRPARD